MAKEHHRSEERERTRRATSAGEESNGESETPLRSRRETSVPLEPIELSPGVAALRPLRSALPRLKSLRGTVARTPRIDVIEREQVVVVRAAIAGVAKDGIDVAVADSMLTIRGTVPDAEPEGAYRHRELLHG